MPISELSLININRHNYSMDSVAQLVARRRAVRRLLTNTYKETYRQADT